MDASCYLEIEPRRSYNDTVIGGRIVRMTKNKPALMPGNAMVRVTISFDGTLFDPPQATVIVTAALALVRGVQEPIFDEPAPDTEA